ncbi:MAG: tRNA pseudouridine(38-40) synthase TruA [bacterium]
MKRIRATVKYLGKKFWGWQIQPQLPTVQEEIQRGLHQITGLNIRVTASGRTDRGVHALGQVIHFDIPDQYILSDFRYSINSVIDPDIFLCWLEQVHPQFHSVRDAVQRHYLYLLNMGNYSPFHQDLLWQIPYELDIDQMKSAAAYLEGNHDFTSLVLTKSSQPDNQVNMKSVSIRRSGSLVIFHFCANRFLHKMIRTIMGTLVDVGKNKIPPHHLMKILAGKDRKLAGETAPPEGLYLYKVLYPDHFNGINSKFEEIDFSTKDIIEIFFR